jgi:hypothetical protein
MFVPRADAVGVAIERDPSITCHGVELIDHLVAWAARAPSRRSAGRSALEELLQLAGEEHDAPYA